VEGGDEHYATARFIATGNLLNPRTRTVPALFEVAGPGTRFTVGQLAQVAVPVGEVVTGVTIPNTAIADDNGTPVAYVQVSGETFERRVLLLGASDGTVTQVLGGIQPGEMVVSTGAYQVRLASMSGNEFAGGHAH
jgi:multidrug efflux pump subunit AcrA (membrane-fusion protein)